MSMNGPVHWSCRSTLLVTLTRDSTIDPLQRDDVDVETAMNVIRTRTRVFWPLTDLEFQIARLLLLCPDSDNFNHTTGKLPKLISVTNKSFFTGTGRSILRYTGTS